jgi:metal-sulfur cluster biosynthetic enzyme
MSTVTIDRKKIDAELDKVVDPELGVSVMELNLIENVDIKSDGQVHVEFHATAPFCPPMFALKIAQDVKQGVAIVPGVKGVTINLKGHYMSEYINRTLNAAP